MLDFCALSEPDEIFGLAALHCSLHCTAPAPPLHQMTTPPSTPPPLHLSTPLFGVGLTWTTVDIQGCPHEQCQNFHDPAIDQAPASHRSQDAPELRARN